MLTKRTEARFRQRFFYERIFCMIHYADITVSIKFNEVGRITAESSYIKQAYCLGSEACSLNCGGSDE